MSTGKLKNPEDIIGNVYGRLTVVKFLYYGLNLKKDKTYTKQKDYYYECLCSCGKTKTIRRQNLLKSDVKSCGCLTIEAVWKMARLRRSKNDDPHVGYLYGQNKNNSIYRGFYSTLTKEVFKNLILDNCHYCGSEPSNVCKPKHLYGEMLYNGIDRIDSTKGYEEGNVVTCCKVCNRAKMDMSYEEFVKWIDQLKNYQFTKI